MLIAQQIGKPLMFIPEEKIAEILALKRRMGFPDVRLGHIPEAVAPTSAKDGELDRLVERVVARLEGRD